MTTDELGDSFPILCETCLGPNPYIRMTKEAFAKACKVCDRPFEVYRWKPGEGHRYKKTEICKMCSKLKNVCQTCILDLQYGLPVQVRDAGLEEAEKVNMPVSTTTRDYMYENLATKMQDEGPGTAYSRVKRPNAMLHRLQRTGPYYERNRPHICSFFLKGTCNRGAECPYRHEKIPDQGPLADQNIKDRFYGVNDPVANKLIKRFDKMKETENKISRQGPPTKPTDQSVRTLYVGGIDTTYAVEHIREHFAPFGAIADIHMVGERGCCFVTYVMRKDAENAVNSLFDCLFIRGRRMKVVWGKGKVMKKAPTRPLPPGMSRKTKRYTPLGGRMNYPSMGGQAFGAASLNPHANQQ